MAAKKTAEFMIVNRRTGKALQAAGTDNGGNVFQAAPTGEDAQLWVQSGSRGPVKLINKWSGKALDVVHGGVESGTWAHLWDDVEEAPSQKWELVKLTATYKKLVNVQSGKVLDIVDMSNEDGAFAQLWDDVDGVGQQWKFVPAEGKAPSNTVTRTAKKEAPAADPAPAPAAEEAPKPAVKRPRTRKIAEAVKEAAAKTTAKKTAAKKTAPKEKK